MFFDAAEKYGIGLGKSIFIGDFETDLLAGKAAGVPTHLLKKDGNLAELIEPFLA